MRGPAPGSAAGRARSAGRRLGSAALAGVLATLAVAGCGGGDAEEVVSETAAGLGRIRSGEVSMRALAAPRGESLGRGAGFTLEGPFALSDRRGALPVADVEYTRIAGPERAAVGILSTGREAFVRVGRTTYELPAGRARELRAVSGPPGSGGLEELGLERWIREPELSDGPPEGGVETDRLTSGVDVVEATNALLEAGGQSPAGRPGIAGAEARRLERAVRSARLELLTGADDRLLRRLTLDLDLESSAPEALTRALGPLGGARFRLELSLDRVNQPVEVKAPRGALPASALGG